MCPLFDLCYVQLVMVVNCFFLTIRFIEYFIQPERFCPQQQQQQQQQQHETKPVAKLEEKQKKENPAIPPPPLIKKIQKLGKLTKGRAVAVNDQGREELRDVQKVMLFSKEKTLKIALHCNQTLRENNHFCICDFLHD